MKKPKRENYKNTKAYHRDKQAYATWQKNIRRIKAQEKEEQNGKQKLV